MPRPLNMIVCVKPIPHPLHWRNITLNPQRKTLQREGVPFVLNPQDKNALEEALRLRERLGGRVVVVSMAPPQTAPVLKEAYSMGADEVVLLSDKAFGGADTLATAYVLTAAVKRLAPYDLILTGNQTSDGATGQVAIQLATLLGIPYATSVKKLGVGEDGVLLLESRGEGGVWSLEVEPPALVAVLREINRPRVPGYEEILEAADRRVVVWGAEDLGVDRTRIGLEGSPTRVFEVFPVTFEGRCEMLPGQPREQAELLVERLRGLGLKWGSESR